MSLLITHGIFAGKCIPITRGGGIYQEHMNEALDRLRDGAWVLYVIPILVWHVVSSFTLEECLLFLLWS